MIKEQELTKVLEALLFASDEPITLRRMREIFDDFEPAVALPAVAEAAAPTQEVSESIQEEVPVEEVAETVTEETPVEATNETAADLETAPVAETPADISATQQPKPVSDRKRRDMWIKALEAAVKNSIAEIKAKYSSPDSPVVVLEMAEGWQFATNPMYSTWTKKLFRNKLSFRLSQAALETIAIIAYKQPITRAEIEQIRGVEVIASLETLLERGLLKVAGRKETVGRPLLYATSPEFLRQFGLGSLADLPPLDNKGLQAVTLPGETPAVVETPVAVEEAAVAEASTEPESAESAQDNFTPEQN